MDDYYDESDELDEFDDEYEDDELEGEEEYDEDYDDYDEDEDEGDFDEERMDDSDVEWAGIMDGESDARNGFPMGMGMRHDDLPDDQKDLYELGYNGGYSFIEQQDKDEF